MKKLAMLSMTVSAALGTGCVSLSTLQSARAVPEGQTRGALGVTMATASPPGASTSSLLLPVPELALRHGLGNGLDVGLKAGPLGSQLAAHQRAGVAGNRRATSAKAAATC